MTTNLLKSIISLLGGVFLAVKVPPGNSGTSSDRRSDVRMGAFFAAGLLFCIKILCGAFFDGFGTSPYDRSLGGIVGNLFRVLPLVFFREEIRSWVLNRYWKHSNMVFLLVLALSVAVQLNYYQILHIESTEKGYIYFFEYIAPMIGEGVLLNYLALLGGAWPGIIYSTVLTILQYTFPILPTLQWISTCVIGLVIPLSFAMSAQGTIQKTKRQKRKPKKEKGTLSLTVTLAGCVLFVWFFAGVFPVYPSVVLTGSMEPLIQPGDIVFVQRINQESQVKKLKKGDILNFQRDKINISHRIIKVMTDKAGNITFETKGDNNSVADSQIVQTNDVKGIIKFVVPKAGLLVLWLKGTQGVSLDNVEF